MTLLVLLTGATRTRIVASHFGCRVHDRINGLVVLARFAGLHLLSRRVFNRRRDILLQFMLESFALSAIGGLAGVAMGILIAKAVAASAGWPTLVQVWSILLATGVAVSVGLVSGIYPAIRASRLDPIDSLRYE